MAGVEAAEDADAQLAGGRSGRLRLSLAARQVARAGRLGPPAAALKIGTTSERISAAAIPQRAAEAGASSKEGDNLPAGTAGSSTEDRASLRTIIKTTRQPHVGVEDGRHIRKPRRCVAP